ncbi:MAG: hypothetical protein N2450_08240 [bacterium]|nr:hypothetical protein [bacterium]
MQWYLWFMLYTILVWCISIISVIPLISILVPSRYRWKGEVAQRLLALQLKMQLLLSAFIAAIYFLGNHFGIASPLGYMQHLSIRLFENYPLLGISPLFVILSTIYFFVYEQPYHWKKGLIRRNPLVVHIALMWFVILAFSVVSGWLFHVPFGTAMYEVQWGSTLSRFFHLLFSALVIVASIAVLSSIPSQEDESMLKYFLKWILLGSGIQLISGTAMIVVMGMKNLPIPVGHIILTLSILLAIGVISMSAVALQKEGSILRLAKGTAYTALLTFFTMLVVRILHLTKLQSIINQ